MTWRRTPSASWHQNKAQRVEHVAEHPGLHQRGDPCRRAGRCRGRRGRRRCVAAACRRLAPSKVVAGVEPGERPQPARQLRQRRGRRTSCSRGARSSGARCAAQVRDRGPVERGRQHATASALRAAAGHRRRGGAPPADPTRRRPRGSPSRGRRRRTRPGRRRGSAEVAARQPTPGCRSDGCRSSRPARSPGRRGRGRRA